MKKYIYRNIINGNLVEEIIYSGGITGYKSRTYINGVLFCGNMDEFTKMVGNFKG